MTTHALAFVNYRYYRTSPETRRKYARAYWYVSNKPRVVKLVGSGGTLWVVTGRRAPNEQRVYSLAYKLVDCQTFEVWENLRKEFGEYGVMAGDLARSIHFPSNNITDVLLNLKFLPEKPIRAQEVIGFSLLNARCLSPADAKMLEDYADKVLHGKNVFISYSTQDVAFADCLQDALEAKEHSVFRDVRSIVGGEEWEPAIFRALQNADAFLLLISQNSAKSDWVRDEVKTALAVHGKPGKLKIVLPIVLSMDAWGAFPTIHRFQRHEWKKPSTQEFFDQVVNDLRRRP